VHGAEQEQRHRQGHVHQQPAVQEMMQALLIGELAALVADALQLDDRLLQHRRQRRPQMPEEGGGPARHVQHAVGPRPGIQERPDVAQVRLAEGVGLRHRGQRDRSRPWARARLG